MYALFGGFAGIIWPCVAPVGAEVVGLQLLPSGMEFSLPITNSLCRRLTLQPSIIHLLACSGITSDLVRSCCRFPPLRSQVANISL